MYMSCVRLLCCHSIDQYVYSLADRPAIIEGGSWVEALIKRVARLNLGSITLSTPQVDTNTCLHDLYFS